VITKKPLWSTALANWHFSLNLLAVSIHALTMDWRFLQGMEWATLGDGNTYAEFHNQLTRLSFIDTIASMHPFWVWRAIGGVIVLIAMLYLLSMSLILWSFSGCQYIYSTRSFKGAIMSDDHKGNFFYNIGKVRLSLRSSGLFYYFLRAVSVTLIAPSLCRPNLDGTDKFLSSANV